MRKIQLLQMCLGIKTWRFNFYARWKRLHIVPKVFQQTTWRKDKVELIKSLKDYSYSIKFLVEPFNTIVPEHRIRFNPNDIVYQCFRKSPKHYGDTTCAECKTVFAFGDAIFYSRNVSMFLAYCSTCFHKKVCVIIQ